MPAFQRLTDWYMVMQTASKEFILINGLSHGNAGATEVDSLLLLINILV